MITSRRAVNKKYPIIILTILIFGAGIFTGAFIKERVFLSADFFNMRFIELGQLITTIFIAIFVTYLVGTRMSRDMKRREILFEVVERLQDMGTDIWITISDYVVSPLEEKQYSINNIFKHMSILIYVLRQAKKPKDTPIIDDNLYDKYLRFKSAVTDEPYTKKRFSATETERILREIGSAYSSLLNELFQYKISLYS